MIDKDIKPAEQSGLSWNIEKNTGSEASWWQISLETKGGVIELILAADEEYPDRMYVADFYNLAETHLLTPRQLHQLLGKVLECMEKAGCDQLFGSPLLENSGVARLLRAWGTINKDALGDAGYTVSREKLLEVYNTHKDL